MSRLLLNCVVLSLAGCAVGDDRYPPGWDPLTASPALGCRHLEGSYADRGEGTGHPGAASLTRELFGQDGPWEKATRVRIAFAPEDAVEVTVSVTDGSPFVRRFAAKTGEFTCERGQMVLRNRRWIYSDVMSGRETVKIELQDAGQHLAAHVHESTTGVMFMVVPLSGESTRWYRFARLKP
jgi:hypothetical protein